METTKTTNLNRDYEEANKEKKLKLPKFANIFTYRSRKMYARFCQETGRHDITYEEFKAIPRKMNELIGKKIASGRFAIRFPNFGLLKVIGTVPYKNQLGFKGKEKTRPDWRHYNATGEMRRVPIGNIDGKVYRLYFYPYYGQFPVLGFYTFKASPWMKKQIEEAVKSGKMANL